jgi:hypothetical protein
MQVKIEEDGFVERLICGEATSHIRWTDTMSVCGESSSHMHWQPQRDSTKVNVFCEVYREKMRGPLSFMKLLWLATHLWTCWKFGCYPNWIQIMKSTFSTGWISSPFSHECASASQSCSSTALDRTCCKWRHQTCSLATPFSGPYTMRFLTLRVRYRQRLWAAFAHAHSGTPWSDNTSTAGHYSGQGTPSLGL